MPMKLFDGSAPLPYVSRATATPGRPATPRPPPPPPRLRLLLPDAESRAKVMPSPPDPPPICAVNDAVRPSLGTGVEYTADPARPAAFGVSTTVVPEIWADPLTNQPPRVIGGNGVPPGRPAAVPMTGMSCAPWPSSELTTYVLLKLPEPVGARVTSTCAVSSGLRTSPSGSGVFTTNGNVGGAALVMVTGRLPVLATVSVSVADPPTGTAPKLSDSGVMDSWARPTAPVPVSRTVVSPCGPVTVIDDVSVPAASGRYVTDAPMDCPGRRTVPIVGSP